MWSERCYDMNTHGLPTTSRPLRYPRIWILDEIENMEKGRICAILVEQEYWKVARSLSKDT